MEICFVALAVSNTLFTFKHVQVGSILGVLEILKLAVLAPLFGWAVFQRQNRKAAAHKVFWWVLILAFVSDGYLSLVGLE
jgi:hypothetical protein